MATAAMIRPYVEQQLAALLGLEHLQTTPDGDVPVVRGDDVTFVRVFDNPAGPVVRFFSPFLTGIEKSPGLIDRINDLNVQAPYVRFLWTNGNVICSMDLAADNLAKEAIGQALGAVAGFADQAAAALQKDFGGQRMVRHDHAAKPATGAANPGGYL